MLTLLITLIILVAILLVLVVLAQNSKGGGLSSQFGGSGASQVVGVKRTGDILEKITWVLAISLVVLSLASSFVIKTSTVDTGFTSPNIEKAQDETLLPDMDGGSEEGLLPPVEGEGSTEGQEGGNQELIEGLEESEGEDNSEE
ncbi:preprotein translocase subunit SecG [Marivirga salinae]|uniref:Protein-export membrane protein SecG n=1 Tax=Marivirga salinarum TaxID=3059078 RepID=A0AA51NA48_9BACT|nr:preprotein translocase subunit SecG [Marivirga sp. BDSF4-3]WMN11259.1 preprotein translocase subunit SecG [Marivirga sp. BDSF4-3]